MVANHISRTVFISIILLTLASCGGGGTGGSSGFRDGGFVSEAEYDRARALGLKTRQDWLTEPDWAEVKDFPSGYLTVRHNPISEPDLEAIEKGQCEIVTSRWSDFRGKRVRNAYPRITDPVSKAKYVFFLNEETNQQMVIVDRAKNMWRSTKAPDYFLVYYSVMGFTLYKVSGDGVFMESKILRDGLEYSASDRVAEIAKLGSDARLRSSPSEHGRWGILLDAVIDPSVNCARDTYEAIETLPFVEKKTGKIFTIKQIMHRGMK
jgi:hypothetical protein